jgi:hypothetical protein
VLGFVLVLLLAGCEMPQLGTAGGAGGTNANVEPSDPSDPSDPSEPSGDAADEPEPAASARDVGGPGPRSGLPWMSGSNGQHEIHQDEVNDFADWRGAPADVAQVSTDRTQGWENMIESSWLFGNFDQFEGQLVISQPPYPEGGDMGACANGDYDGHWERFGEVLIERDRADAIVRVGWEFNGDWMYWSAHNPQQFIDCFRNVSTAIKRTDPDALIEWTANGKGTVTCDGAAPNCYPGDDVVDIIGIDYYDQFPPTRTPEEFETVGGTGDNLLAIHDFAREHDKPFAVGEWGVVTSGGDPGGDNPAYIRMMMEFFEENAEHLAYEAYFSICGNEVASALHNCDAGTSPDAAAEYQEIIAAKRG